MEAGVGQAGQLLKILLEVGQAQDIAQADAHEFSVVVPAQPQMLVFILESVTEVVQGFFRRLAPAQAAARDQFIHHVRRANRKLGQELGPVEQKNQQFEDGGIAVPQLEQHGTRPIGRDETVQPRHDAVGVGKNRGSRIARCGGTRSGILHSAGRIPPRTHAKQSGQEFMRQPGRALRNVNVTRAFDEFAQHLKGLVRVPERVLRQEFLPGLLRPGKLAREGLRRRRDLFGFQMPVEDPSDLAGVRPSRRVELSHGFTTHQPGQALPGGPAGRDRMGLQILLHLETVLHVAEKTVGAAKRLRFPAGQQVVLRQLLEAGQRLRALQERLPPGVEQLLRLHEEFNLTDAAPTQLYVAIDFAGPHHFIFDPVFHGTDLLDHPCVDRPRVSERLDHFKEFPRQSPVSANRPGFDQHHPFPRLPPLGIVILVTAERPRQRPGVAFGPQPEVDPEQHAGRRHARHFRDECFGEAIEELVIRHDGALRFALDGRFPEHVALLIIDKHHVHIRTVIQFLPAQFAETQHAKPGWLPSAFRVLMPGPAQPPDELPPADLPHAAKANVRHVGKFAGDLRNHSQAHEIARGNPQHFVLFELAQPVQGHRKIPGLDRWIDQGGKLIAQPLFPSRELQPPRVERTQPVRMGDQQVSEGLRTAEQRRQNLRLIGRKGLQDGARGGRLQGFEIAPGALRVG